MRHFEGIAEAADAVRRFCIINEAGLPDHVKSRVLPHTGTGSSPVDLIVNFTHAVYRNRDTVAPAVAVRRDAMAIAAGCADLINQQGYHGRLDGQAAAMVPVLRRDSGEDAPEGTAWPDPADDPKGDSTYAPPPPAEAPGGES